MTRWNKILILYQVLISIALVSASICLFILGGAHHNNASLYRNQLVQNFKLKRQIRVNQQILDNQAYIKAIKNSNTSVRLNIRQIKAEHEMNLFAPKLFRIITSFSSSNEYEKRAKQVTYYMSKKAIVNQKSSGGVFQSDKVEGTHYVDTSGLHNEFISVIISHGLVHDDKLTVLFAVRYKSWHTGENRADTTDMYIGTYNYAIKKFTTLKMVNNLSRENERVNDDE